jgi:hypothetical protein
MNVFRYVLLIKRYSSFSLKARAVSWEHLLLLPLVNFEAG